MAQPRAVLDHPGAIENSRGIDASALDPIARVYHQRGIFP
jgi:hypothetical protein